MTSLKRGSWNFKGVSLRHSLRFRSFTRRISTSDWCWRKTRVLCWDSASDMTTSLRVWWPRSNASTSFWPKAKTLQTSSYKLYISYMNDVYNNIISNSLQFVFKPLIYSNTFIVPSIFHTIIFLLSLFLDFNIFSLKTTRKKFFGAKKGRTQKVRPVAVRQKTDNNCHIGGNT